MRKISSILSHRQIKQVTGKDPNYNTFTYKEVRKLLKLQKDQAEKITKENALDSLADNFKTILEIEDKVT